MLLIQFLRKANEDIESLSPYARQFLGQMERADVDEITGLSPAIAIGQKALSHNPRSIVGTLTEIYDYLRVLYARLGEVFCNLRNQDRKLSSEEMIDIIIGMGAEFVILNEVKNLCLNHRTDRDPSFHSG